MKRGRATAILPDGYKMEVAYQLRGRNPETQRVIFWPYWAEPMPRDLPSQRAMWEACVRDIAAGVTPRDPPPPKPTTWRLADGRWGPLQECGK